MHKISLTLTQESSSDGLYEEHVQKSASNKYPGFM